MTSSVYRGFSDNIAGAFVCYRGFLEYSMYIRKQIIVIPGSSILIFLAGFTATMDPIAIILNKFDFLHSFLRCDEDEGEAASSRYSFSVPFLSSSCFPSAQIVRLSNT